MRYRIKIVYESGSSFGTEINERIIEDCFWDELDVAERNMMKIVTDYLDKSKNHTHTIVLTDDYGTETSHHVFWKDYFGELISVEVVLELPKVKLEDYRWRSQ